MSETAPGSSARRPETGPELVPAGNQPAPDIYVAISNISLPLVRQMHDGVATTERRLEELGDGRIVPMEITPTKLSHVVHRAAQRGQQLAAQAALEKDKTLDADKLLSRFKGFGRWRFVATSEDEALARMITSTHQAPYDAEEPGFNPTGMILLRDYRDSMDDIKRLHEVVGELPSVVFTEFKDEKAKDGKISYQDPRHYSPDISVQPKPGMWVEDLKLEEISELDLVRGIMKHKGIDSLTVDGFHIWNKHKGRRFRKPMDLAVRLSEAGLVNAYHLALGRVDNTKGDPDAAARTIQAREAFIHSPEAAAETFEGELLQQIVRDWRTSARHAGQSRRVVIETLPELNPLNARQSMTHLRAIVEHARALIAAA